MSRSRQPLGQHFLADRAVLDDIVGHIAPKEGDIFVEVGPGRGQLTAPLLRSGARVVAIERDRKLADELPGLLGDLAERCEVVVGDAAHGLPVPEADGWRLAGNIPYEISSPLLKPFARGLVDGLRDAHLMLQREFAVRLAASPGTKDYGKITVSVQSCMEVEVLFDVPPEAFDPPPKVVSSFVRLTPAENHGTVDSPGVLEGVLFEAFKQKRKKLSNSLEDLEIDVAGTYGDRRADDLSVAEYVELANRVEEKVRELASTS